MWQRCQQQYYFRYIEGKKYPPGIAALKGSGVHSGAKENFSQKIKSHKDLKKKDIIECSIEAFNTRLKDGVMLTQEQEKIGKRKLYKEARNGIKAMSEIFIDEVAPEYQPTMAEEWQRIVLPGPYDIVGVMDLADDKGRVIDLKTSSRKKNEKEVQLSEQLTFYALIYRALTGKYPKSVRLEVLVNGKSKSLRQTPILEYVRTEHDVETLVNRINTMIAGISAGVFMPCERKNYLCSPNYCGFYFECPYV
jgi:hypothetical protein